MAVVEELIKGVAESGISFGNHTLLEKAKKEDYEYLGDIYKVKTFKTMTKLEKNGLFVYESVPGTTVNNLVESASGMTMLIEGDEDAQITLGLDEDTEYQVFVDDASSGKVKTNLGGKLSLSVELGAGKSVKVEVRK